MSRSDYIFIYQQHGSRMYHPQVQGCWEIDFKRHSCMMVQMIILDILTVIKANNHSYIHCSNRHNPCLV